MTHGQEKKQLRESNPGWPKCWNQQTRISKQLQKFCHNGLTKGQIPVEKYRQKNENYYFNPSGNFWVSFCSQVCQMPHCPSFIFPAQTQKQTGHLLPGGLTPPTHILESIGIACHLVMFKVLSRGLGLLHFYVESKTIQKYKK